MEERNLWPSSQLRAALRAGVYSSICIFAVFNFGFFVEVLRVVGNRAFLGGFGTFLIITVLVSIICGGLGVVLGKLIELNEWLSHSTIRALRLGRWLPFFVFWALPIWQVTNTRNDLPIVLWLTTLTIGIIAAGPTVLLGACYYYLSHRTQLKFGTRCIRFQVARSVSLLALLICLLFLLFFDNGWPWHWYVDPATASINSAAAFILLLTLLSLLNLISQERLDRDLDPLSSILTNQFHFVDGRSLAGAILISIAGFLVWQLWNQTLQEALLIATPAEVTRATQELLVSGSSPTLPPSGCILHIS